MNNNKTRQTIKTYTTHNKTLNNKKRKTQTFLCFITNNIKSVWAMVTCIIKNIFFFPFNLHVLDPESAPPSGSSRFGILWFIKTKQHYDETNNQEFIKYWIAKVPPHSIPDMHTYVVDIAIDEVVVTGSTKIVNYTIIS